MGHLTQRLARIAGSQQANAVVLLQDALAAAGDQQIAQVVDAYRRGERDEASRRFEALGVSEELLDLALGADWSEEPQAAIDRRLSVIFADAIRERRGRIRGELSRLSGEVS